MTWTNKLHIIPDPLRLPGLFSLCVCTGFLKQIGTKLRDRAVGQAGAGCYSVAELQSRRSKRSPFFPRLINQVFPNFIPALDRFEERNRGGFLEDFIDIEREFFNI